MSGTVSGWLVILQNVALLAFLGLMAWLHHAHPSVYYASVQEDQALEWASFWSFLLAGGVFVVAAWRQRRTTARIPWFLAGLALFSVIVAMEEISWGQRVFGQQPPEYFLAENYQQEINVHNFVSRDLRVWAFRAIILGYGVLLPLLTLSSWVRRRFDALAVVTPPIALMPGMFALFWVHLTYPWKFTGEIIECGLGFGFLFAALAAAERFGDARPRNAGAVAWAVPIVAVALAFATASWSRNRQSADDDVLAAARAEVDALANDFRGLAGARDVTAITDCNLHKRLFTFAEREDLQVALSKGTFASRIEEGMPSARADYFLDPWNLPYWIRDRCDDEGERRVIMIYSFGPNRSRDSSRWEIRGDDVGAYVLGAPNP